MNKTYKWPFSFLLTPYTKSVFGLSSQKPLRSFSCCFYIPVQLTVLNYICQTLFMYKLFNIFLLLTWHPLSNFDLLTQLLVTLVSQNIVINY